MLKKIPTVQIKHPDNKDGVIVINECDYDKAVHGPIVKGRRKLKESSAKDVAGESQAKEGQAEGNPKVD